MKLEKMTQTTFTSYFSTAVKTYAAEKVKSGAWEPADSLKNAKNTFNQLLPDGLQTPENYLFSIVDESKIIGHIWLGKLNENNTIAFIYDFEIYKDFQNSGFGTKALELAASEAKKLNFSSLGLHVFGSNARAIHVYEKSGFKVTDLNMQKEL